MDKRKECNQFSEEHKKKIPEQMVTEMKKSNVTRKYGISPSTLSMFLKDRDKIEKSTDSDAIGPQRKKNCTVNNEVDKAVYRWFLDT
jgi:hypothetical protein